MSYTSGVHIQGCASLAAAVVVVLHNGAYTAQCCDTQTALCFVNVLHRTVGFLLDNYYEVSKCFLNWTKFLSNVR